MTSQRLGQINYEPESVLLYILVYTAVTVASIDTQCIDSNLERGRYITRVGWASRFLSLVPTVPYLRVGTYGTYGTVLRYLP